ncbi:unnamed protein product, partial [marine sediment metagenome]
STPDLPGDVPPKPPKYEIPEHRCPFCPQTTKSEHLLNMHIISKHKEEFNERMR